MTLTLGGTIENDMIRSTVVDNGVGISQDACDRLFERYIRGKRVRSTGIGLGLYFCRQIITARNGQISAISLPGARATF